MTFANRLPPSQTIHRRATSGSSIETSHHRLNQPPPQARSALTVVPSDDGRVLQDMAKQSQSRLAKLGERTAMIVHEARNPLTTILMALQSFQNLDLPNASQRRLGLALEEAERLQRLLNEILLFASPLPAEYSILEINTLMADLFGVMQMMPTTANRTIRFLPASDPIEVLGNADKLKQIMINLLNNACEASSLQQEITWRVIPVKALDAVCIQIHNWGPPIAVQAMPHLTTPFFSTKPSGKGLGLAVVNQIVEDHHGQLQIQSDAQSGTLVSVRLPVQSP